mmetsp:Transcript_61274/g.149990  ORF Transcript_61274/g.149990 Transcript_61274/m.149990 type:complete len:162 (+) Transcript_61274:24-509(+)|eukprot:CAMPEP_0113504796 /NCGR_PEP_ID=MMETSP0014_2-20120614/34924_1 /TAXON_ID=2857 /ORGANISM="Nitzschia sp." /LENGTH=161 /DNA_ID=CAMNT_0000399965 /DNA_START=24 /DNA_END=509 /DNA_ORIENTATION=+ /assembly_acc=CAM_ASM_000159
MTGIVPADALALGIGAFFGALSRYQAGRIATEFIANDPNKFGKFAGWHTAGINVGGSFLLGGISGAPTVAKVNGSSAVPRSSAASTSPLFQNFQGLSPRAKLMMGVGFCGSFTTFSTFSVDVVSWIQQGQVGKAASYVAANNVGGFIAAGVGMALVKKFFG